MNSVVSGWIQCAAVKIAVSVMKVPPQTWQKPNLLQIDRPTIHGALFESGETELPPTILGWILAGLENACRKFVRFSRKRSDGRYFLIF